MKHGHLAALADDVLRHVEQIASNGSAIAVWAGSEFIHQRCLYGLDELPPRLLLAFEQIQHLDAVLRRIWNGLLACRVEHCYLLPIAPQPHPRMLAYLTGSRRALGEAPVPLFLGYLPCSADDSARVSADRVLERLNLTQREIRRGVLRRRGVTLSTNFHLFLLLFHFLDNDVQLFKALGPELAIPLDPRRFFFQSGQPELAGPHAPDLLGADEPRLLQDPYMFLHASKGHMKPLGKGCDRSVCTPELLQNAASGGVRESAEQGIKAGLTILHYAVQRIPTERRNCNCYWSVQVAQPEFAGPQAPDLLRW